MNHEPLCTVQYQLYNIIIVKYIRYYLCDTVQVPLIDTVENASIIQQ